MPHTTRRPNPMRSMRVIRAETEPEARQRRTRHALADLDSVIYFVPVYGMVKIGTTTNLPNRLSHYGLKLPDLLLLLPGGRAEERAMHERFAADLVRGREWFRPSADLRQFIDEQRRRTGIPPAVWPEAAAEELALLTAIAEAERDEDLIA